MNSKLSFYIDSKVIAKGSDPYQSLCEGFQDIAIFKNFDLYRGDDLFCCILTTEFTDALPPGHILFEFQGGNTSLFTTKENSEQIKVKSLEELLLYKDILRVELRNHKQSLERALPAIKVNSDRLLKEERLQAYIQHTALIGSVDELIKQTNIFFAPEKIEIKTFDELQSQDRVLYILKNDLGYITSESYEDSHIALYAGIVLVFSRLEISFGPKDLELANYAFSMINFPFAMLDNEGSLILHNSDFLRLSTSTAELLKLRELDHFRGDGREFVVHKKELKFEGAYLYIFLETSSKSLESYNQNEELGIISSSIAHELNNPLGGILAAIDVIRLDDLESELDLKLLQMKEGVTRCKDLVQTFLGFSRRTDLEEFSELDSLGVYNQALSLLRFRLVESNISIDSQFSSHSAFLVKCNPYVMTMIIYLILGEIVTNYARGRLIREDSNAEKVRFLAEESSQGLSFSFKEQIKLSEKFMNTKLFIHLLERVNMKLSLKEHSFSLTAN